MTNKKRTIKALSWSLVVLASGCAAADPTAVIPQTQRLSQAEARWRDAGIRSYVFYSTIDCECLPAYASAKRATVRDGVVVRVTDVRTGEDAPTNWRLPVDSLFRLAREQALVLPSRLEATFDARTGYPRRLAFGEREVDSGAIIVIDSLRAVP